MPLFVKLPSGLILNLALVRRVEPSEQQRHAALRVYFAEDEFTILDAADSDTLRKRLGLGSGLSSTTAKVAIFWIAILSAIVLVWTAVRRST